MTIKTAFVLGAGLGTRLRPLTNVRPKPLIPVCNRPLITYAFDHLIAHGIERFVVNTHWLPEVFTAEFPTGSYRGIPIYFRNEAPEVLETGGGIKNVENLLGGEPFLVYNGDILCDFSIAELIETHLSSENEVTLALRSKDGPLQVAFDSVSGHVTDIGRRLNPESDSRYLFTGIYAVAPAFLKRIPAHTKVSVIPHFLDMIRENAKLRGVLCEEGAWWDLGTREQYLKVHRFFADRPETVSRPPWIDADAEIDPSATLEGHTAVGSRARIGPGARLRDCIVWPGARVASESDLTECIATGVTVASGAHKNTDF